jgi:transposase InsO family protein
MVKKHNPDEIALERYRIILPILTAEQESSDSAMLAALKTEACKQAGVNRKTLNRWLSRYRASGFDGLKNQASTARKFVIPDELLAEAIQLRRELPSRSVPQIIEILELEGKVASGVLKRTTLQDRLQAKGFSAAQMKMYRQPGVAARRFQRLERNDMWQSDIKFGPFLRIDGKLNQVYFVGFIDDATRYIVHGEFYDSLDQSIVEDCLRKAILKEGLPQRLFFDNGKQFKTKWMERACAVLDIKLIFARPYSPESKGKIERFNNTLNSFIAEANLKQAANLDEYNHLFNVWLQECYHSRTHEGIGESPELAYKSSRQPLRFLPPETIANAFLRLEQRKVDKSGCFSFAGRKYEAGVTLIGRKVDVLYDPSDISVVTVEDKKLGVSFTAKELAIGGHTGPRPKMPEFMTAAEPETSRLLDVKQEQYEKRNLSAVRAISYAQVNEIRGGGDV